MGAPAIKYVSPPDLWKIETFENENSILPIKTTDYKLSFDDLYFEVIFTETPPPITP